MNSLPYVSIVQNYKFIYNSNVTSLKTNPKVMMRTAKKKKKKKLSAVIV